MKPEAILALRILSLFREGPLKPRGTLSNERYRQELLADQPIAAYFLSVIEGGDDAWRQERMAIGRNQLRIPREDRGDPMCLGAIIDMFPIWRRWGQMLIDAGQIDEVTEESFAPRAPS